MLFFPPITIWTIILYLLPKKNHCRILYMCTVCTALQCSLLWRFFIFFITFLPQKRCFKPWTKKHYRTHNSLFNIINLSSLFLLNNFSWLSKRLEGRNQRHVLKNRRPNTAACPACWRWGQRNWNSVLWGKRYTVLDRLEQPRQTEKILYQHDKPNEPTKGGPLSFVLCESPFASVSTVNRSHPSLVSLGETEGSYFELFHWRQLV